MKANKPHKLQIDLNSCGMGTVKLNGKELNVKGVKIETSVGKLTTVTLTFPPIDVKGTIEVLGFEYEADLSVPININAKRKGQDQ